MSLTRRLLERGLVTPADLKKIESERTPDQPVLQILVERGVAKEPEVLALMGEEYGLEIADLSSVKVAPEVLGLVPSRIVHKRALMPLSRENGTLIVATANPDDLGSLDELQVLTGLRVRPVLASPNEINRLIKAHFGVGGDTLTQMVAERGDGLEVLQEMETDDSELAKMAQEASVVKLVNEMLIEAINERASDIHIEPGENALRIRYRIDGILVNQNFPPEIVRFQAAITSRLKIMARLNIAEKRLPQDGRIKMRVQGREVDVRVSIIPMNHGEGIVLRILDKSRMVFNLANIGMLEDTYTTFKKLLDLPHGIILVTGPTGSGKSTTLYSALNEIKDETLKIITVEDPVEYQMNGISQIQVHSKIGLSFAAGLRSILRHDPDVILIGEIRDMETAESAIQASLTGHVVFSTLHTNDAPSAFTRLIDMGLESYLVASTVQGVQAQRLVRTICKECKESYLVEAHELPPDFPTPEAYAIKPLPGAAAAPAGSYRLYRGAGCGACHGSGYKGRVGIYELMITGDTIRDLCVQRVNSAVIKKQALKEGMITLRQDGFRKVHMGMTTVEEVARATQGDTL